MMWSGYGSMPEAQAGSQRSQPRFDVDVPRKDTRTTWTATIRLALDAWSRGKHPIRKSSTESICGCACARARACACACACARAHVVFVVHSNFHLIDAKSAFA